MKICTERGCTLLGLLKLAFRKLAFSRLELDLIRHRCVAVRPGSPRRCVASIRWPANRDAGPVSSGQVLGRQRMKGWFRPDPLLPTIVSERFYMVPTEFSFSKDGSTRLCEPCALSLSARIVSNANSFTQTGCLGEAPEITTSTPNHRARSRSRGVPVKDDVDNIQIGIEASGSVSAQETDPVYARQLPTSAKFCTDRRSRPKTTTRKHKVSLILIVAVPVVGL